MNAPRGGLLRIHGAVILFGLAGLFGKWLDLSPIVIVAGRVLFASAVLALGAALVRAPLRVTARGDRALLVLQGLLLAAHWGTFFWSIQVSTVAVGLLSYSSFPIFTAFLEPAFFRRRLEAASVALAIACLAGVFLIVPRFSWTDSAARGVGLGLLSGLTFAFLSVINRRLSLRLGSIAIAFWQDFVAALVLLPIALLRPPALKGSDLALLAVLGIFCTAGAHTLFIQGLRTISAQAASVISALEPVYGIALAFLFLHEVPAARTLLGGAVILAAVLAASWRSARRANAAERA